MMDLLQRGNAIALILHRCVFALPPKTDGFPEMKRLIPLLILVLAILAAWYFDLAQYFTFDALRDNREVLTNYVRENALLAVLIFGMAYVVTIALSLPFASFLTITGGFLFGQWLGTATVVFSATVGAAVLFLIAKTALGDALRSRAGPWMQKLEEGFNENSFSYLLTLRLIPLFPFFVVNLVPALLGMRLMPFFVATLVGIIPGSFVYVTVGAGLGSVFDSGEEFSPSSILTPEIITALVGLAVLSLLPIAYKRIKARRSAS